MIIEHLDFAFSPNPIEMNRHARSPRRKGWIPMTTAETHDKAATAAEQGANAAPAKAPSKKHASQKKGALKAKKSANPAKAAKAPPAKKSATDARANKKAEVIAMMKRAKGVTLAEIVEATGWQRHTVRGFVSILGSKGGEKIESSKNAAGERSYRIAK
jgi:hypothetical protein